MALISPEGNWERINNSLSQILGYSESELKGFNVKDITYVDDISNNNELLLALASSRIDKVKVEKCYIHKSGTIIWVVIAATMLKDSKGNPLHFISQIEDITKRKEIEENLLLSEKKYRTIFENVQDVFYRTDNQNLITEISPSIEKNSGYSRKSVINQPVDNFYYYPKDRERILALLKANGSIIDFEVRLKTSTDELRYASVNARLVIEDGVVQGTEGSLRDVTTRKFQEIALKTLNTELTASNEQKNKLLSIIGHDLRNPISGSLQLLDLTLMDFESNTADELHMYLSQMKQELSNANNLLEDLLAWAKIQFKSISINQVIITEITAQVQKSIQTVKPMADKKNISITLDVEAAMVLYGDIAMLDAIFRNLLTNAIKFTNKNGEIKVKAIKTVIGVKFSITDNGVGMTKDQIDQLFNNNTN
ncbi:PAS domain S-box-containing protein [Pedobacter sp. CG_S7]|uniref:PAS domain S-box protein n=1 Tax=Pedobacter sp. CG_S7 TaxID=3143930 RepID=UPI00339A3EEE